MTLFTFNTNLASLLDETKLHSLRFNLDYWMDRMDNHPKLDIWWLNPRNQHPDCRKLGIAFGIVTPLYGHEFTAMTAKDDGYVTLFDLFNILMELHKMECEDVMDHQWASIRWTWTERYWK